MIERESLGREYRDLHPQVLIVSRKLDPHVDIIAKKLNEKKIPFVRFNTEDFPLRTTVAILFDGSKQYQTLTFPLGRVVQGNEITGVWYRRPAQF